MNKLIAKTVYQGTIACPAQFDVELDNNQFIYIRYRNGNFKVILDDKRHVDVFKEPIFKRKIGNDLDGYITIVEIKKLTEDFIDWSRCMEITEEKVY